MTCPECRFLYEFEEADVGICVEFDKDINIVFRHGFAFPKIVLGRDMIDMALPLT
jgi:hypothetical protein